MLQFVAVCCSVLQCAAVYHNTGAVDGRAGDLCCSVLRCVAVYYSVLQCVAVCCSVLHYVAMGRIYQTPLCVQCLPRECTYEHLM